MNKDIFASFVVYIEQLNPVAESLASDSLIDCTDKRLLWNFLISNKCFRTEMLKNSKVRFPPLRYSEDGAFTMQLVYKENPKIIGVDGALFKYRRHTPKEGFSVSQSISTRGPRPPARGVIQARPFAWATKKEMTGSVPAVSLSYTDRTSEKGVERP